MPIQLREGQVTRPLYFPNPFSNHEIQYFLDNVEWLDLTGARRECFMALEPLDYTYGSGRGERTYSSVPYDDRVDLIREHLNTLFKFLDWPNAYNVCFLNRYDDQQNQLGWHADDSPGMSHEHPIAVVSFGAAREIWWRDNGQKGVIPPEQRQMLAHGSLFVMPPGFQMTHQHRIPKADRAVGPRVSLTFRRYVP